MQQYNRKHQRSGHVFEQRYQAIHCDKDQYLLSLINYILKNPVRAGMESGLDYEWSSHRAYVGTVRDGLVDTTFPFLFEGTPVEQRGRYIKIHGDRGKQSGKINTEISKRLNVLVVTVSMILADEGIQDRMKSDIERIRIFEA